MLLTPVCKGLPFTGYVIYSVCTFHGLIIFPAFMPLLWKDSSSAPSPIVLPDMAQVHQEEFGASFTQSPSLTSPLQSVTAQSTHCGRLAMRWGGSDMATSNWGVGGQAGQNLPRSLQTLSSQLWRQEEHWTPTLGSLGWNLKEAFSRLLAFVKCNSLSVGMYACLHFSLW